MFDKNTIPEEVQKLRDQAEQATDCTVKYIQHDPIKSMLIAASVGAALMALVGLFTRSHHRP
jgi:ElaB/YqjD/DUF883 family membrane-anchored ribosome-binding protein